MQLEQQLTKQRDPQPLSRPCSLRRAGSKACAPPRCKYFGKEPQRLSVGEAALLVALPQAPEARRLDRDAEAARARAQLRLEDGRRRRRPHPAEAELASNLNPCAARELPDASPRPKPSAQAFRQRRPDAASPGSTLGINFVAGRRRRGADRAGARTATSGLRAAARCSTCAGKLLAPLPTGTHQDDRDALWMFYAGRNEPVWVDKTGWTPGRDAVIDEMQARRRLGARRRAPSRFPRSPTSARRRALARRLAPTPSSALSLAVLKYARYARGGRIEDPATQLSSYLDRKPQVRPPFLRHDGASRRRGARRLSAQDATPASAVREAAPAVPGRAATAARGRPSSVPTRATSSTRHNAHGHRAGPRAARRCRRRRRRPTSTTTRSSTP